MATSREVLRLQVDLRDRLQSNDNLLADSLHGWLQAKHRETTRDTGRALATVIHNHVAYGHSYHVEANMVDVLMRRVGDRDHFSMSARFSEFVPPTQLGFCVFEKTVDLPEIHGRMQRGLALSWGPAQTYADQTMSKVVEGRMIVLWTNTFIAPDEVHEHNLRTMPELVGFPAKVGGWVPAVMDFFPYDAKLGPARMPVDYAERQLAIIKDDVFATETINQAWVYAALWELMGETVVARDSPHLDRATQRFARRNHIPTDITTMTLRREAKPVVAPGSGTPLSWRIPVDSHQRTYHRGTPEEFTIWVRPHWRGPQDAEVRQTKKVRNLKR
jgi:hypothetical protein